jgi:hypothetical protein|tara:strand:+ start:7398 stop:7838 length:441 start_codon:yes stop_codon:yes gene_type:complete
MHKLALKSDNIKKVRVSEKEHTLMIELLYDEIRILVQECNDATIPEEKDFYGKEKSLAILLLRKILPDEPGGAMNRAKRIINNSESRLFDTKNQVKPFNTLNNDPINNAIRKDAPDLSTDEEMQKAIKRETSSRMGQAGCRGGECD